MDALRLAGRWLVLSLLIMAGAGCGAHLYSPPGRVVTLETARPLQASQQSVGAFAGYTDVTGIHLGQGALRYRHGTPARVDVGVDANVSVVTNTDEVRNPPSSALVWGGRLGAKWAPEALEDFAALTAGVGGGGYAGGGFFGPDLGVVIAWENAYAVPFLSAVGYLSVPVAARDVDLTLAKDDAEQRIMRAQNTWGGILTMGLQVPVDMGGWVLAPTAGVALHGALDEEQSDRFMQVGASVDVIY